MRTFCSYCHSEMFPITYGSKILVCQSRCHGNYIDTEQMGVVADTMRDCHCTHCWYDHIGWRRSNDNRSNCRIVRCGCECYTERNY